MIPRNEEARARALARMVKKVEALADAHQETFLVVHKPGPSSIHGHITDLPYYVRLADADAYEQQPDVGQVVVPRKP